MAVCRKAFLFRGGRRGENRVAEKKFDIKRFDIKKFDIRKFDKRGMTDGREWGWKNEGRE